MGGRRDPVAENVAVRVSTRLTRGVASVVACLATGAVVSAQDAPVLAVAPFSPIGSQPDLDLVGLLSKTHS